MDEQSILTSTDKIHKFLCRWILERQNPEWDSFISRAKVGDFFYKGKIPLINHGSKNSRNTDAFVYIDKFENTEIDDPKKGNTVFEHFIHRKSDEIVSYWQQNIRELNGHFAVPYSKIVEDRVGQCLEMSLAYQLHCQMNDSQPHPWLAAGTTFPTSSLFNTHTWNFIQGNSNIPWSFFDIGQLITAPIKKLVVDSKLSNEESIETIVAIHPDYEKGINQGKINKIYYLHGNDELVKV